MDPNKLKPGDEIEVTLRGKVTRAFPDIKDDRGFPNAPPLYGAITIQFDGASDEGRNYFRTNVLKKAIKLEVIVPEPAIGDLLTPGKGERPTHKIVGLFKNYWIVSQLNLEGEEMYEPVLYSPENFSDMERTPAQ